MSVELQPKPAQAVKKRYYTRARVMRRLLLLFGLYIGMCAGIAWLSVYPHRGGVANKLVAKGLVFENVTFYSEDGTRLSGWFLPATGSPKGVIVFCHGVDGNRVSMFETAMMLHKHGYAALLFDFRARGESEGARSTLGWKETDDLLAAISFVKHRTDMRGAPIGVMGHSMGGAVALMGAAKCSDVRAVIAESAYAQLDHAVHNHFQNIFGSFGRVFEYPTRWFGERLIGQSSTEISPVNVISRISPRAVLLIEDTDDKLCPLSESRELFQACGEPKQLWTVPHAGHIQAIEVQPEEFERQIDGFFDGHLRSKTAASSK